MLLHEAPAMIMRLARIVLSPSHTNSLRKESPLFQRDVLHLASHVVAIDENARIGRLPRRWGGAVPDADVERALAIATEVIDSGVLHVVPRALAINFIQLDEIIVAGKRLPHDWTPKN